SPVSANLSPLASTRLETNSIFGYFSTSKKSALRRCSSRRGSPLLTLAASTVADTDDWNGSSAIVIDPSRSPKTPRTVVQIRCRATNSTDDCDASIDQVPGSMMVPVLLVVVAMVGSPSLVAEIGCGYKKIQGRCIRKYSRRPRRIRFVAAETQWLSEGEQ